MKKLILVFFAFVLTSNIVSAQDTVKAIINDPEAKAQLLYNEGN